MFTINQNLIDDFADKINEKEKKNNKVTSWSSTTTDAHYPSERLVKDSLDSKASSSHTHGNLQNNGQVGSTAQANKNVVTDSSGKITTEDKPTIPSASSTTPSADTTNGSAGTGTTWARSNHTHPKSSLYAEANHTHSNYLTSHQDISGKEDKTNKVTSWSSTTTDTHYPSEKLVKDSLDGKQEELVSGTNLKTLNGVDLLGEGDIAIDVSCGGSTTLYNPKLDGTEPQITLDEDNVFTTGNGVAGGLNQVGYIGDGFDNSTDWELTLTLTTALWGGGLTILLNPYTIEDATCSNSDKWNCYFQNNNADLLQWLDGAIKINSGSNLSNIGISYTRGTTVNIKIVKEGTTFKYYENGTLKGSYTWAKLGTASKVYIGVMGWGGYAHSFTNVLAKSLYNQVVFNESSDNIIKLGDDIIDLIDNTLGHMISNWEDYE